jgi:hypothetical protein
VEPDGDVAAVGVDGGEVGAAAQPARPPKLPAMVAGQVGQGERGLGFGAGQQQLASGGEQVGGREPELVLVAGMVEEAGRALPTVLGDAGGDQQPGRELGEQLGRARDRPGCRRRWPSSPTLRSVQAVAVCWSSSQTAGPSAVAATSCALPRWTAAVRPGQIPYTSTAGWQPLQTRSERITACPPTGSTDTTRSPPVGRPVTGCTRCRSRSTTNGAGSLATSSRSRLPPPRGTPASGRDWRGSAVVEGVKGDAWGVG